MRTFLRRRPREEALPLLKKAGWELREKQTGGDFEDFIRSNDDPGILLVDFCFGRFLLDRGDGAILSEATKEGDAIPEYNAILDSLFDKERIFEEPCDE